MESTFVLTRCGDDLFCIAAESPAHAQALAKRLREAGGWQEVVPGIDSVVVQFDPLAVKVSAVEEGIERLLAEDPGPLAPTGEILEIPVVYGGDVGPDLEALCASVGMSRDEFTDLHTGRDYPVDMVGFTPGFAFIGGLDDRLRVPRRREPRQRVPAGSIGIADGRTGLYAMASPGGWNIIGRTPLQLFDPDAADPFALKAGMRVRFRAVDAAEWDD